MSLIHEKTRECMKSELELFDIPDTQTAVRNWSYIEYYPLTSLDRGGPIEFSIKGNSETYLDLNESVLFLEFSILDAAGDKITKVVGASTTGYDKQIVAPINAFHSSVFRGVDIYLNSKLVSQTDNLYGYKSYIQKLLTYGYDAKNTFLECGQFYNEGGNLDDFNAADSIWDETELSEANNEGLAKRFILSHNSKTFCSFGRIHSELFQQQKYLPGNNELRIKLHKADANFALFAKTETNYIISISKAVMYIKHHDISAHIREAHVKTLMNNNNLKFPIKRVEMKFFTKGSGRSDLSEQNLASGTLPRRVFIGLVESESFNGKITKNPFNFQNFKLNEIVLRQNGVPRPYESISVNYTENIYNEGYFSLLQASGKIFSNESNAITLKQYKNGYALYGFDLTNSHDAQCYDLINEGNLSLTISLAETSTVSITVIAYLEYDNIIEIDKDGQVITNYE